MSALVIDEGVAQAQQGRPLDVLLWEAKALADDVAQLVGSDVVVCGEELGEPPTAKSFARRCLDDDDARPPGRSRGLSRHRLSFRPPFAPSRRSPG